MCNLVQCLLRNGAIAEHVAFIRQEHCGHACPSRRFSSHSDVLVQLLLPSLRGIEAGAHMDRTVTHRSVLQRCTSVATKVFVADLVSEGGLPVLAFLVYVVDHDRSHRSLEIYLRWTHGQPA